MPQSRPNHGGDSDRPLLSAQVADVATLATLLRSVALAPHAIVTASEDGLEVVTELNRTIQAHAYLYASLFDRYEFIPPPKRPQARSSNGPRARKRARNDDDPSGTPPSSPSSSPRASQEVDELQSDSDDEPPSLSFEVNLQTWLSCLNIFGGANPTRPQTNSAGGTVRPATNFSSTSTNTASNSSSAFRGSRERDRARRNEDGGDTPQGLSTAAMTGATTAMTLAYKGIGHPLTLQLMQDATVKTRCEIATYEAAFLTDLSFDPQALTGQVILSSDTLHTAFSELEASCSRIGIFVQPPTTDAPSSPTSDARMAPARTRQHSTASRGKLCFKTVGDTGESEMEFPFVPSSSTNLGGGVMEKFLSTEESRMWWYPFGLVGKVLSCLKSSIKTSLRIDQDGLCSLQFMLPLSPSSPATSYHSHGHHAAAAAAAAAARDMRIGGNTAKEFAFVEVLCVPLDDTLL
ncbi:checkpoint clamp complex protein Rad1 [Thecaphora frezii]